MSRRRSPVVQPPLNEPVVEWVARLWGITRDRQTEAQERLAEWGIGHVVEALSTNDADGAIAAAFLVESVDELTQRGVDERKLLSKLRGDPDVWPTWTEIRSAGVLARHTAPDAKLLVEPDRSGGRHADLVFVYGEHERASIEFKAIGLSDQEVTFARSMAPLLPGLLPRFGVLTMHLEDTETSVGMNRDQRRAHRREAERRSKYLHPVARQMAAAVVVGHGTEARYVRRLSGRLREALDQLPSDDACWVAFHWSNGAPTRMVARALRAMELPEHVAGVVLIGTVAIPGRIDDYIQMLPAPFDEGGEEDWRSDTGVQDAKTVFNAVDASAGVRPTFIRVPWKDRMHDFLLRTGERRILPFNVVLSPDPSDLVAPRDPECVS